jgi:hypothetical protein
MLPQLFAVAFPRHSAHTRKGLHVQLVMLSGWKPLAGADMTTLLPGWAVAAAAALILIGCAPMAARAASRARRAAAIAVGVVVTAGVGSGWLLDHMTTRELADERRALEERAFDLKMRALAPGSALACLDPTAGAFVQDSCERALFASPEATATAVSYVTAQLALLASGSRHARIAGSPEALTALRRTVEADRFGIVAYLVAMRPGCGPDRCDLFDLLQDTRRLRANLAAHQFEAYVQAHTAEWQSAAGPRPTGSSPAPVAAATAAPAPSKPAGNLFFPSASSIPSVSIMMPEPATGQPPREATASADPAARNRKPQQGSPQPRQLLGVEGGQAPSAPLQIVPPAQ